MPTPWLQSEVARISDQIRAANYADPSREVYTNADFDESIRFLTTWAQTRSDIVRAQVAADRAQTRRASSSLSLSIERDAVARAVVLAMT